VAVSLADKLDTLRSFFGIDEKPTGSKDPFALRRAALGIIRLIQQNELRMSAGEGDILDFFADRLKVQQKEAGVRHDIIDAVFATKNPNGSGEDDLVRLLARVKALQAFIETPDGTNLLAGYKRAANILKKEEWDSTGVKTDREPAEEALVKALSSAQPKAASAIKTEDFAAAMSALATLRAPIDEFFTAVTVNDPDKDKRAARLDLLSEFRDAVHQVADFSRIEG
jgi:glycyl-tRNA synthetase beta chain